VHTDIHTPQMSNEIAVPRAHAIGVVLTTLYIWTVSHGGRSPRNLSLALAFGLFSNLLPWPPDVAGDGIRILRVKRAGGAASVFAIGIWYGVMAAGIR